MGMTPPLSGKAESTAPGRPRASTNRESSGLDVTLRWPLARAPEAPVRPLQLVRREAAQREHAPHHFAHDVVGVDAPAVVAQAHGSRGQPFDAADVLVFSQPPVADGVRLCSRGRRCGRSAAGRRRCGPAPACAAVEAADHDHDVERAALEHAQHRVLAVLGRRADGVEGAEALLRPASPWRSRMAARSISWISRLSLISIVVWLARPSLPRSRSGSKPGLAAWAKRSRMAAASTWLRMNAQTSSASSLSRTQRYWPPSCVSACDGWPWSPRGSACHG